MGKLVVVDQDKFKATVGGYSVNTADKPETTGSGRLTYIATGEPVANKTTQTRAALPLPSVGVLEKEPTIFERVGKTLTAAGKGTLGDSVNILGTMQDIDTRYRAAKERMGDTSGTVSLGKEGYSVKLGGSKESDAKAKAIQTAADRLKESSAADAERAKQGLGGVGRFAVDLGVAGAQMAGDIALGALGGTGALAPMAARVFGGSTQEARQSGASLGQQLAYGAGSAALSVATEQIANTSKLMQKAFGKSTLASAVAKKFGDKGVTKAIAEAVNKMQQTAVGRAAINAISEGGEEFIEDIFQPMLQRATYDKDAKFDLTGAIYDAAVGGALGVIGGIGERKALPLPTGTEAQENTAQSEFDRIRLKTAEEEAAMQKNASEVGKVKLVDQIKASIPEVETMGEVATVTGNEISKEGNITSRILNFVNSIGNKVTRTGFGDVFFSKARIKSAFVGHGIGNAKIETFAAVPEVIRNGKQIGYIKNVDGKGYDSYVFAAPINYKGAKDYLGVIVTKDVQSGKYYVHEVVDGEGNLIYGEKNNTESTSDGRASLSGTVDTVALPVSENSMPENGGNVKSYNAVMPRGDEGINTEANQRSEQSEFERIRIKSFEEEQAERERAEREEKEALKAQSEANRQAQRMTDTDYEQQRRDLDEYWEMVGKQATMTREAPEKADTADLVTSEVKKEEKTFKESVKDLGATLRRKWIDSADAVREIGKAVGDKALYPYFNMARASSNAALNMITTAQTNVKGETVGKSLNDIFGPIRAKGNDYYNLFQTYLFHRHNVDRMSRYSQENVNKAAAAMQEFKTNNPELLMYEQYQLEQMAQDEWSDYNVEAKEYLRLLRELRKAESTKNKPVFGFGWGAEESQAEADKLLREHPEFETLAEDVYTYTRNLMQYRADSGLITEEQRKYIEQIYPHYVPTFRVTENTPLQMDEMAVQIGSTIKQAKGGDQKLIPLHKALADQTMSVVREGSKNRFGQRLLSAERSKAAKEHLRHVEETENGFSADTFDDTKDDFDKITNTFTVRANGKRYDITVSPDLYEGIKALTPEQLSDNKFLKGARRANDLFKKLCTSMSPTFMIRNPIKDLQDAGLYSKDATAFAKQFPRAAKEISMNGEYWQRYKALGGTYTSFFDYETGDVEKRSKLAEKTVGRIETLNDAIEQAPRLAEFMATVEKAGGLESASMDTLMQAMNNAADVTVNFGRSGTIARTVNRYVPFFNAGMQGLSKNVRLFTETKGSKEWTKLVTKCVILGVVPRLANELLFGDRDDWDDIKDEVKDQNYLFPIGENKWLKIPKGRALSTFGLLGNAAATAMSGEEIDARYILSTAADNLAPANPLKNNIFAAAMDSDLFDPSSPGTTWYGGDIESQRLQNYAPGERYDAKTDEVSKWLGKTLGLSPKKINYILDQYTGFAGDVLLPMMTTAAETSPFVNAFVVNSTTNNRLSGDFYDKLDELTFAKNGKDATGADAVTYRWFNKQSSAVSEINAAIREIEADATLSGEEKKELLNAQYKIRNAAEKSALDTLEKYADAAKFYYGAAGGDENERVDDAYLRANREVFGAAYALQTYNKQVYEKAVEANAEGVDFDDYFDFYFATRGIEADKDANGNSISGSKKEKVLAAIDAMDIPDDQKDALYLQQGYSEKTINEAPWHGGKALGLPKLPELKKLELPALELPALELPR